MDRLIPRCPETNTTASRALLPMSTIPLATQTNSRYFPHGAACQFGRLRGVLQFHVDTQRYTSDGCTLERWLRCVSLYRRLKRRYISVACHVHLVSVTTWHETSICQLSGCYRSIRPSVRRCWNWNFARHVLVSKAHQDCRAGVAG